MQINSFYPAAIQEMNNRMNPTVKMSRRRNAAVKFLSNISLGNDDSSNELFSIENESSNKCVCYTYTEKPLSGFERKDVLNSDGNLTLSLEAVSSARFIEFESTRVASYVPFRERTNTGNSDYGRYVDSRQKKRIIQQSSYTDDGGPHYFSSSESISSGRNKSDASEARGNKIREVHVVQPHSLQNCRNERIMLLTAKTKTPFYVFSFIPYKKVSKSKLDGRKEGTGRRRNLSGSRPLSSLIDTLDPFLFHTSEDQMISYSQLLIPTRSMLKEHKCFCNNEYSTEIDRTHYPVTRCMSVDLGCSPKFHNSPSALDYRGGDWDETKLTNFGIPYSPFLLDDPEFISGRHKTVMTFNTYRTSVIDYIRPTDLKRNLNEKFKEKFPYTQLTLTKLRSLKNEMRKIGRAEDNIDLLTVSQAYVYFEKLILKNVVNKSNRKLCAATCLILSAKMNDTKGSALKSLFEKLESGFRLSHKDILAAEFPVLVMLEFSLHLPTSEVLPHFQRLLYES